MFVKDFAGDQTMHMDGKLEGFSTIDLLGSPSLKSEFCCFYQSSSHKIPIGSTEKIWDTHFRSSLQEYIRGPGSFTVSKGWDVFDFLNGSTVLKWIAAKVMRAHIWMEMVLCDNMADMSQNGECLCCLQRTNECITPPSNLDDL